LQNYVIQVLKVELPIDIELLIELYRSEEGLCDSGNANYLNTSWKVEGSELKMKFIISIQYEVNAKSYFVIS